MAAGDAFVWPSGQGEVTLSHANDAWTVEYISPGRLRGPRQVVYRKIHRDPTYAVWDVLARVVIVTRDEDEGVRAGSSAAQWINAHRHPQAPHAAGP